MKNAIVIATAVSAVVASLATVLVMKAAQSPSGLAAPSAREQPQHRLDITAAIPGMAGQASPVHAMPESGDSSLAQSKGGDLASMSAETEALNRRFRSQPKDAAWASKTEQTLRDTMTSDLMVATEIMPSELSYSCRTDLCLVKAQFTKYGDAQDWGVMLVTAAGTTFVNAKPMVVALPNGKTELQLYATRP